MAASGRRLDSRAAAALGGLAPRIDLWRTCGTPFIVEISGAHGMTCATRLLLAPHRDGAFLNFEIGLAFG
jgi:hypothetical protein